MLINAYSAERVERIIFTREIDSFDEKIGQFSLVRNTNTSNREVGPNHFPVSPPTVRPNQAQSPHIQPNLAVPGTNRLI